MEDISSDQFTITENHALQRIDKVLYDHYEGKFSRSYFQYLIDNGHVSLNGKNEIKKRIIVKPNDEIEIFFENVAPPNLEPENIPIDVVYEDEYILIVNKKPGMVVHPAPGNWSGTFVNALLYYCQLSAGWKELLEESDVLRPGIIHRLDKDTSGLLVAAKTSQAHRLMTDVFAKREVVKEYLAVCVGNPSNKTVEDPIGRHPTERYKMAVRHDGKPAKTIFNTIETDKGIALTSVGLYTGRTHQIRVHLAHIGCPLIGDPTYGSIAANKRYGAQRQMLHAWKLSFKHPFSNATINLSVPPPSDMLEMIKKSFSHSTYNAIIDSAG